MKRFLKKILAITYNLTPTHTKLYKHTQYAYSFPTKYLVGNFSFIRIIQVCQDWIFRIFAVDFKEKTTYDRLQTIRFAHLDYGLYFTDEDACRQAIIEKRWGVGEEQDIICPYCGGHHCVTRKDKRFRCRMCKRSSSCKVGTIFEDSNLSLQKWLVAMYLISSHKKGVSSCQLARDIKVTQKTAWYMLQKIRLLYQQSDAEAFNGTVERDEVYIGGKEKWKHMSMRTPHTQGRSTKTKTPVFGMMERSTFTNKKGVVENTNRATLQPIIQQFVEEGSRVITDELNAYNGLNTLGYAHAVVNHGVEEYADGDVFTNSIEGFWSHFSRMISGCYHDVSDAHLKHYIDEAVYLGTQEKWTNWRD